MKKIVLAILFIGAVALAAYAINVLLLGFAGILMGILLRSGADWVHDRTHLRHGSCIILVVAAVIALFAANIWLFGLNVADQVDELSSAAGKGKEAVQNYLQKYEWSRRILSQGANGQQMVSGATSAVSSSIHFVAAMILMIFIALYTASNPDLYIDGFTALFPKARRKQVNDTLHAIGGGLRWWLLGQLVSMAVVGALTTIGLWALGVPLPVTLGFITAVLNFIPNIGAILSAAFAATLGLTKGPDIALYALGLFVLIQACEAYILTPLIQQRAVSLPPALTIMVQAFMGVAVGLIGIALAAPLTVVGLVLTKRLHLSEKIPTAENQAGPRPTVHRWQT
jgi:predicted PurR-regulated permease PerM